MIVFTSLLCLKASAQQYRTVELKPIQIQGWKYYYDFKRVNSPFSLEIPLEAIEDDEINNRIRKFKNLQSVRGLGYLGSLVYLASTNANTRSTANTFLGIFAAGIVLDLSFNLLSHRQMKRAVDKYNLAILKKRE